MSSCVDTTALITKLFPPFGRASIIVFELNGHYKNKRTMSSMGRYIYVGQEKFVFRPVSPLISETVRDYAYNYFGSLTGSRRWLIEPCHLR